MRLLHPGFVVAAAGILTADPEADDEAVLEGLSGNLCRCTGYTKILEAVGCAREALTRAAEARTR